MTQEHSLPSEWAQVSPTLFVGGSADGKYKVIDTYPLPIAHDYSVPMTHEGHISTTRTLLEAALVAAYQYNHKVRIKHAQSADELEAKNTVSEAREVHSSEPHGKTLLHHAYDLCRSYQTTHATPRVLHSAAKKFSDKGFDELADFCALKAREETGHDKLALNDLIALSLPGEMLVDAIQPECALSMVAYFDRCLESDYPIEVLGYAFALERMAVFNTQEYIDELKALMPPGVKAYSCAYVHSAVGSDAGHVEELIEFISKLSADDRIRIAKATFETIIAPSAAEPVSHGDIEILFRDLGIEIGRLIQQAATTNA